MAEFAYTVKRTNRRSVSVRISEDNSIVVSCPRYMSEREVERFVNSKADWIKTHLAKNLQKISELSDVISYINIFVAGERVPLIVGEDEGIFADCVKVKGLKRLKKLYVDAFGGQFIQLLNAISAQTGLTYSSVSFRDYKARWGCCDRKGVLVFNYKLLMLDENLWRYVICHELCHTRFMNHSKDFYSLLLKICPDYKSCRTRLKRYSRISSLY